MARNRGSPSAANDETPGRTGIARFERRRRARLRVAPQKSRRDAPPRRRHVGRRVASPVPLRPADTRDLVPTRNGYRSVADGVSLRGDARGDRAPRARAGPVRRRPVLDPLGLHPRPREQHRDPPVPLPAEEEGGGARRERRRAGCRRRGGARFRRVGNGRFFFIFAEPGRRLRGRRAHRRRRARPDRLRARRDGHRDARDERRHGHARPRTRRGEDGRGNDERKGRRPRRRRVAEQQRVGDFVDAGAGADAGADADASSPPSPSRAERRAHHLRHLGGGALVQDRRPGGCLRRVARGVGETRPRRAGGVAFIRAVRRSRRDRSVRIFPGTREPGGSVLAQSERWRDVRVLPAPRASARGGRFDLRVIPGEPVPG